MFITALFIQPGGPVVKNLPANEGDLISILIWEDSTCRGDTKSVPEPAL